MCAFRAPFPLRACPVIVAVSIVAGLLAVLLPSPLTAQMMGSSMNKARALEATIQALAANGSRTAWATLREVVSGKRSLGAADEMAAELALRELVRGGNEQNDAFLIDAMVRPEAIRPQGQGTYTAGQLQADAGRLLAQHASARLRTALARCLADPAIPKSPKDTIAQIILASHPANLPAQATICFQDGIDQPLRAKLLEMLHSRNGSLLDGVLGTVQVPPEEGMEIAPQVLPEGSDEAQDPAEGEAAKLAAIAEAIWNERFIAAAYERVGSGGDDRAQVLALLASLPLSSARARLSESLQEHWLEGPNFVGGAQIPHTWLDPGAQVVLKSVPHAQPAPARRSARSRTSRTDSRVEKRRTATAAWFTTILQCTRAQCQRFHAAAASATPQPNSPDNPGSAPGPSELPFPVGQDAKILAQYHVELPRAMTDRPAGADADRLVVDYARLEEQGKPSTISGFYRRSLSRAEVHEVGETTWIEALAEGASPDLVRSVDVLVTGAIADQQDGVESTLTIEILAVEVADLEGTTESADTDAESSSDEGPRTWTDSTGQHTFQGELVEFKDGNVLLKAADGKIITVPLDKLSEADQDFVKANTDE